MFAPSVPRRLYFLWYLLSIDCKVECVSVQYLYPSWASYGQTWIHYKSSEVYVCTGVYTKTKEHCSYVNYQCQNIHSLVTIWGTTVYDHIWHFSVCLSHETCVFHHTPSLIPRLSCVRGLGTRLPYISDQL